MTIRRRTRKKKRKKKERLMSIIVFCQRFSVSRSYIKLSRRKKRRMNNWSLCILKHVDALSEIEQVDNDALNFSCCASERMNERQRESRKIKQSKLTHHLLLIPNIRTSQEIEINYILFLALAFVRLSLSSSTFIQNTRDNLTGRRFMYRFVYI